MSKAFVNENSENDAENDDEAADALPPSVKNYMTPAGAAALREEYHKLIKVERPKVVETVAWAASNGDRSENGDYIYGKKRLREIDRRARYLSKRLESAEIVDPARQQGLERVYFGATVTYGRADGSECIVTLVGVDEADASSNKISWLSPVAKALMKAQEGDNVTLRTPSGSEVLEVIAIEYRI